MSRERLHLKVREFEPALGCGNGRASGQTGSKGAGCGLVSGRGAVSGRGNGWAGGFAGTVSGKVSGISFRPDGIPNIQ